VAPLFAIHGLPKTPEDGESFVGGPGSEMTRNELEVRWGCLNVLKGLMGTQAGRQARLGRQGRAGHA
jgi:hypothetical protein